MDKAQARNLLRERRAKAARALGFEAAIALRDQFLASVPLSPDALVAATIPMEGEIDPSPLIGALSRRGYRFCLPCEVPKGAPLVFRAYKPSDTLRVSVWGIHEPLTCAPIVEPDVVLTPLVGFDRRGYRLGQGGGFYDRTLAALRAKKKIMAIGLAYSAQEETDLPSEFHDAPLDLIVTEREIIAPHA